VIEFEQRKAVGVATINREERRNALNAELCDQLRAVLDAHRDLRALVITGAGTAFCAGADLGARFEAHGDAATDTFRPAFELVLDSVIAYPAPVIAAINGPAIGAGMQLAVACDIRVATRSARLGIPGGKLGILLSPRNIWRLAQLVGQGPARDFLLTGRTVDAEEAARVGLVQYVDDDARVAALALAEEIALYAPLTVQGHKRALNLVAETQWLDDDARAQVSALEAAAFASEDLREGMAAFAEKRPPHFHGR
jgi:enoyl-CoA hydratase